MNEAQFRKKVKKHFFNKNDYKIFDVETIADDGFPDLYIAPFKMKDPFWIELKVVKNLQSKVQFRASQLRWHRAISDTKVKSFILVLNNYNKMAYLFSSSDIKILATSKLQDILNLSKLQDILNLLES